MDIKARDTYLNKLKETKDTPFIKIISGVRRCGKSTLLGIFESYLLASGIEREKIIRFDMDSRETKKKVSHWEDMYDLVASRMQDGRYYVLLDEVQNIKDWESALISMYTDLNADIYVTGSNAMMLSPDLGTKLVGRFIEIRMLPLSFREFLDFTGAKDTDNSFKDYLRSGGFPAVAMLHNKPELQRTVLDGIYNTILSLDIGKKNDLRDSALLKDLAEYLIENVGNTVSTKSISDFLSSNGRKNGKNTIENYLLMMERAFLLYRVRRYDIKGKMRLKTLGKYYVVDTGFRSLMVNDLSADTGRLLENVVYLELIRRGFDVSIGKVGEYEIDFIAERGNERMYIQVAQTLSEQSTREREIRSLIGIKDGHPKLVISMDPEIVSDYAGVKNRNIVSWLLEP